MRLPWKLSTSLLGDGAGSSARKGETPPQEPPSLYLSGYQRLPDIEKYTHPTTTTSQAILNTVKEENVDVLRGLLVPGTDLTGTNKQGDTALRLACRLGNAEYVRLLLDSGANVNLANTSNGGTPLIIACQQGHKAAARLLLEGI